MTCPICSRDANPSYRPFCSRRCADVDLARWLTGSYAIQGDAAEDLEGEGEGRDEAERARPAKLQ